MHAPDHAGDLPEHIDPIPMPDTPEEAAFLRVLLDLGFYPSCEALSERIDSAGQGKGRSVRREGDTAFSG